MAGAAAIAVLCMAGVAVVATVDTTNSWQRDDWRRIVKAIPADARIVIAVPEYQAHSLRYYDRTLVNADDDGSHVREVVVVRPAGGDLATISVPAAFNVADVQRLGRWEVVALHADAPAFIPAQAGRLARSPR